MLAVTVARIDPQDPLSGLEIGEHPDPTPAEGWEVVQVKAAALNHHDVFTLRGVGVAEDRLPIVLGGDGAGVTRDGREVIVHAVIADEASGSLGTPDGFGPGTSLLSEVHDGTQAELVAVPRQNLVDKPAELSFAEAACLPVAYLTAYRMLFVKGACRPGDRVLIQGAGGGLATALILLGRAAGLKLYVTSRDAGKAERAQQLGAHVALESGARLPERVDAVMESVGEATWAHSLRAVEAGGTIVVAGATSGPNPPAELQRIFFRQVRVVGSTMGTRAELVALVRFLLATGVRPLVDTAYPLAEARVPYARMVQGDLFGKLVLEP